MSSGAAPTNTFNRLIQATDNGDNTFSLYTDTDTSAVGNSPFVVDDPGGGTGSLDNRTQLGDVSNDSFISNGVQYIYLAKSTNNNTVFAKRASDNYVVAFTNGNYPSYAYNIPASTAPYTVCYVSGTQISTARGNVVVENLVAGDLIVTASGFERPIRWIGHRTVACCGRTDLMPVRIAMHAFGEGRPARDLFVSPAHAIAVDVLGEVLIPACRLINGTTITQVDVEEVTYWHVELDSHDILLAEGLPAESFLDCGNRRFFANADITDLITGPDARPEGPLPFCRPFHEAGPLIDLVRTRLTDRAEALGWRKVPDTFAGLHLVANGVVIRPDTDGLTARFVVPADAHDVRLVSATSVPAHVVPGSSDDRRLGVALAALSIDDGLTGARAVALDDTRFGESLYGVDGNARWTNGSAVLPPDLWDGCKGWFFLRVMLAGPALPRWIAPEEAAGVVNLVERRKA